MKKKVLIVDLDGTLYSINTFHYFIKYVLSCSVKKFDVVLLVKMLIIITSRMFNLIPHSRMKYYILKIVNTKNYINFKKFVNIISFSRRNISLVDKENFDIKILATAAPSCYANIIAENEGFDKCLGTEFPNRNFNDEFENIKEVKKNSVVNYLNKKGVFEIDTLVTDHIDDLPLMKLSAKNIIFNPNNFLKRQLKLNFISYEEFK